MDINLKKKIAVGIISAIGFLTTIKLAVIILQIVKLY